MAHTQSPHPILLLLPLQQHNCHDDANSQAEAQGIWKNPTSAEHSQCTLKETRSFLGMLLQFPAQHTKSQRDNGKHLGGNIERVMATSRIASHKLASIQQPPQKHWSR